jgi:hypothetical protein
MAELFKFRCFQCQKLIGAPASKFGKVVHCPRCNAELIVPSPDDEEPPPEQADPDAFRPEDLGLVLSADRIAEPKVAPPKVIEQVGPDPIAFLQQAAETGESPPEAESQNEPNPDSDESQNEPNESPDLPEPVVEPLVARKRRRQASTLNEPTVRARDVVLPRTAAVAWAMFALLALAFAFTSGIFVGHFLWK